MRLKDTNQMSNRKKLTMPILTLDSSNPDSWAGRIKVFLIAYQNMSLKLSEKQVKRDGSSSIEILARMKAIELAFPCPVEWYDMHTYFTLRFRLGEGPFVYTKSQPNFEILEILKLETAVYNRVLDPRNHELWVVMPKDKAFDSYFLLLDLNDAIESMARTEMGRLLQLRQQAIGAFGFRPIKIRLPNGNPDIRIKATTRIRLSNYQQDELTAQDLVSDMQQVSGLLTICPDGIEQVIQRTRLLYVNAYHEWKFFTISIHYAVLALEASLRMLYDEWLGVTEVEVSAEIEGSLVKERMTGPRENILKWVYDQKAIKVVVKGLTFPRNKPQLLNHAVTIGALSLWERERCEYLLKLRDDFSHPIGTFIEWISRSRDEIADSCLWINLMWARFHKSLPYEFAWEHEINPVLSKKKAH